MTDYQRVAIKKFPKLQTNVTPEHRYWRKFRFPITYKEYSSISSINFSSTSPHDFAVTSSTRVQVYSAKTNKIVKSIARFKDTAYSGDFRNDGKLIVAGDETGKVQVFDTNSRMILRTFLGHTRGVHVTRMASDTKVMSASDDVTVRCWDMPSGTETLQLKGHTDYVRAGVVQEGNSDIWLTGGYDHTVKLWDLRTGDNMLSMNHGAPVESVLMFAGGNMAVSAGGNTIKIWDILGGGRELHSFSNHQKTITSLCFNGNCSRLLSGSLDHHVKIYDIATYKVLHGIKYTAPVMSMALSPTDSHLVVGMSDGTLSIKHKPTSKSAPKAKETPRGGTYKYFVRGKSHKPQKDEVLLENRKKKILKTYDVYLKKFRYSAALDAALEVAKPIVVVSVMQEIVHRGGIRTAISGRDEIALEPLLQFLVNYINNPRYSSLLLDICSIVLDVYASALGQSIRIDELIIKLQRKIKQEIEFQKKMFEVLGTLDIVLAGALQPNKQDKSSNSIAA